MLNEIPALEVITAIENAEFENYVSELLFSQGWSIIYRALSRAEVEEVILRRQGQRTILIYTSDFPGFSSDLLLQQEKLGFTAISLDVIEGRLNPHLIMSEIRATVRTSTVPISPQPSRRTPQKVIERKRVITITGTSGSPGRTLMATSLAEELAFTWPITVVDGDFRSRTLTRELKRFRQSGKISYEIASLDSMERPTQLPDVGERDLALVDIGPLPPLNDLVNDRRWQASLLHSILESTTHLVFICKSTMASIDEVQEFIDNFPPLLKSTPVTFICINQEGAKSDRQAIARCESLVGEGGLEIIHQRVLVDSFSLPLLSTPTRSKREIARIGLALV